MTARRGLCPDRRGAASTWCVLAVVLLASGCGFHLRTWDLDGLARVYLAADASVSLSRDLTRALEGSGVIVVRDRADAEVVVRLSGERQLRRGASVTGGARVAEYEMGLVVSFGAEDGEGEVLVPTRTMRAERTYRLDIDNLIGSREEETLIVRELRADLVQRVVRSLGRVAERARGTSRGT